MNALWWWIDRWRKSTAYTDMTLEQQGAYRNLLDEASLRGGAIPNNARILAKACGDATAWRRVRAVVLARFELRADGWHNATLDSVLAQSERRAKNQASYRQRTDNKADNAPITNPITQPITRRSPTGNKPDNKPDSPSPSLSVRTRTPLPPSGEGGVKVVRQDRKEAKVLRDLSTCTHEPRCATYTLCVERIATGIAKKRRDIRRTAS